MTSKEAVKTLLTGMHISTCGGRHIAIEASMEDDFLYAVGMAISVLMKQEEEKLEHVWHDAETDPPKSPGKYYGKKDDTNSMWLCNYRDGVWTMDGVCGTYPIDIIQWAEYTDFKSVD